MSRAGVSRVLIAAAILVLSACQADVEILLDVNEDGSGSVEVVVQFDDEAVATLGGIEDQLRIGDLERAGWDVSISPTDDGGVRTVAVKAVRSPEGWQATLDEIAGPGVFEDVSVVRTSEFARQSERISMTVDLGDGWDLFSDDGVAEALRGERFGAPIDSLTQGRPIDDIIRVSVTTSVASDDDGSTSATTTTTPRFDGGPSRIGVESSSENSTAVLLRWIAIAFGALFVLATALAITGIVLQRRVDRLRPPPRPARLASRVPGTAPTTAAPAARPAPSTQSDSVRLVVVEPRSVLYRQSKPIGAYLLPFVRHNHGTARADTILEGYEGVVVGSMDTATFWRLCGVAGDPSEIDETFVEMRRLRTGAGDFLAEMQRRRIPVAATTNDAAAWSELVRDRDRLSAVWPWLISAQVGAKKPDLVMFEILRRESGVAHGHCLYVDTDLQSLDAAKELGMNTALFNPGDLDLPDVIGHPVVSDFKALFAK